MNITFHGSEQDFACAFARDISDRKALEDAEVLGRIRLLGGDVFADASQQSAGKFIAAQQALWAKVIKERNITTA